MIELEQITVYRLEFHELEKLVIEHLLDGEDLGEFHEFSIVALEEWDNDEDHLYTEIVHEDKLSKHPEVYGEETPNYYLKYNKPKIEKFIKEKTYKAFQFGAYHLLVYLCTLGVIPEGNYLIEVSW